MPYLAIDSRRIYFEWHGRGPVVTLLHHATASSRNWRRVVPALAESHRVLVYDRPGFGRSSWVESWPFEYHQEDVTDLMALLDALAVEQTALVGHSDGATVALLAAAAHGDRVRCVLAEAPHVAVETPRCSDAVRALAEEIKDSPALRASLARDHGERGIEVVMRWFTRWQDPDFWRWDVSDLLARVMCPVLVVHGANDPFFSAAHSQMIAERVANGRLCVLPDAGHAPHDEARARFLDLVLAFLDETKP